MKKLKVTKETKTGKNIQFKDTQTGKTLTLNQAVKAVQNGTYSNYHVRNTKNGKIIASNPDGKKSNNLG